MTQTDIPTTSPQITTEPTVTTTTTTVTSVSTTTTEPRYNLRLTDQRSQPTNQRTKSRKHALSPDSVDSAQNQERKKTRSIAEIFGQLTDDGAQSVEEEDETHDFEPELFPAVGVASNYPADATTIVIDNNSIRTLSLDEELPPERSSTPK